MLSSNSQAEYWNRVAHEKRFSHPLRAEWLPRYLKTQALILDYGCGYGRTLVDLSGAGFTESVGADFSEEMLVRCRRALPSQSLIRNNGQQLPFRDGVFDAVLLFAVLTCIPLDSQQRSLIAEISRVLRPSGLLYISDLLLNDDERNLARYAEFAATYDRYGVFALPEDVIVRHHSLEWINDLTGGFEQLEHEPFTVTTMNGHNSSAFQSLLRKRF